MFRVESEIMKWRTEERETFILMLVEEMESTFGSSRKQESEE
jgi:hypothetical protein